MKTQQHVFTGSLTQMRHHLFFFPDVIPKKDKKRLLHEADTVTDAWLKRNVKVRTAKKTTEMENVHPKQELEPCPCRSRKTEEQDSPLDTSKGRFVSSQKLSGTHNRTPDPNVSATIADETCWKCLKVKCHQKARRWNPRGVSVQICCFFPEDYTKWHLFAAIRNQPPFPRGCPPEVKILVMVYNRKCVIVRILTKLCTCHSPVDKKGNKQNKSLHEHNDKNYWWAFLHKWGQQTARHRQQLQFISVHLSLNSCKLLKVWLHTCSRTVEEGIVRKKAKKENDFVQSSAWKLTQKNDFSCPTPLSVCLSLSPFSVTVQKEQLCF